MVFLYDVIRSVSFTRCITTAAKDLTMPIGKDVTLTGWLLTEKIVSTKKVTQWSHDLRG